MVVRDTHDGMIYDWDKLYVRIFVVQSGSRQGQEGAGGFGRHNDPVSRLLQLEPLKRDDSATATTIQSDEA